MVCQVVENINNNINSPSIVRLKKLSDKHGHFSYNRFTSDVSIDLKMILSTVKKHIEY